MGNTAALVDAFVPYYRYIMPDGLAKFARYAINVWGVRTDGKMQEQTAEEGLQAMEGYMREIGVIMNLTEVEVKLFYLAMLR